MVADSLWEQCNTGLSERPSGGRSWTTPASETVTLDHMLIGLYQTPHDKGGQRVTGENALFKWSSSGNHVVIKCSMFMVDAVSLNGAECDGAAARNRRRRLGLPEQPDHHRLARRGPLSRPYPGGIRVVTDPGVWSSAVDGLEGHARRP